MSKISEKPAILKPSENLVSIDWLEFTLPTEYSLVNLPAYLELGNVPMVRSRGPMMFYSERYQLGPVKVLTGSRSEMGHHVIMSGSACREVPAKIHDVLRHVARNLGKVTRIDLALDIVDGSVDLERIKTSVYSGTCVSIWKDLLELRKTRIARKNKGSKRTGETLYFGSKSSRVFVRFYDKGLETGACSAGEWIRCEVEFRREHAEKISEFLLSGATAGELIQGTLSKYLSFRVRNPKDSTRSRWLLQDWWISFLSSVEKIRLSEPKLKRTLIEKCGWFRQRYGVLVAQLVQAFGPQKLHDIYLEGLSCMTEEKWSEVILAQI